MRALVLSGGSIKGSFQAGAIQNVLNRGFEPNLIYGVSVGSINGAFLADRAGAAIRAGNQPDWPAIGDELVDFWTDNIRSFKDVGKKRKTIGLIFRVIGSNFTGLLKMKAITKLMRETFDMENIRRSPALYHAGFVDLESGDYENATHATKGDNLIEFIIASTREPIIMPIHFWQNRPLVDGGARNIAPLGAAIDAGADEIVAIACQSEEPKSVGPDMNYGNFLDVAKRSVDILTNEIVNEDLKLAKTINDHCLAHGDTPGGHRFVPITVIRPDNPLRINITKFTAEDIRNMIDKGRAKAAETPFETRPAQAAATAAQPGAGTTTQPTA